VVEILDTTLREGEQTPGVTFSNNEKLIIANLLDDFGVDIIEAGHPSVSKDIFKSVKELSNQQYNADILAHCRALKEDIDAARSCDVDWIGIFFCVSNNRLEHQFRLKLDDAADRISTTIEYAKCHGLKVRYTPEDTIRTEFPNLITISQAAVAAGVDRISIADTVGATTPYGMYSFVKRLKSYINVKLNAHCHNDLGLATANALAAYEAGISLIDVSVNGIGERVGITSLSEICTALHSLYNDNSQWKLDMLPTISQTVSNFSGLPISKTTPIIGENAFTHNAGLHVTAVLNNPSFYEAFPPKFVGRKRTFILDKMASKQTIIHKLQEIGLSTSNENIHRIMEYVKSKEKGGISDDELSDYIHLCEMESVIYQ
jgi:2-isopropylmalate synthase